MDHGGYRWRGIAKVMRGIRSRGGWVWMSMKQRNDVSKAGGSPLGELRSCADDRLAPAVLRFAEHLRSQHAHYNRTEAHKAAHTEIIATWSQK